MHMHMKIMWAIINYLAGKGANPNHQNPAGIKITLPKSWNLDEKVEGKVNDEGIVNFFF